MQIAAIFFYIALIIGGGIGWVLNIVKLVGAGFDPIGAEVVLRVIGIFMAPLGAILGYIGHF